MKNIRLVAGLSVLGLLVAVACGDDSSSNTPGGSGSGGASAGNGGKSNTGGKNNTSGSANDAGSGVVPMGGTPTGEGGTGNMSQAGADPGPGCGDGPACDESTQECIDGVCKLIDGEACATNADCVHTCIGEVCAPRADVLEECDFSGGGAGGAGSGGAPNWPSPGGGGEGGETIFVPPEEMGNGDDADCLDGLGCGDGTCKRKQGTDCTGVEQCLSGICHKGKCTPEFPGYCQPAECALPNQGVCSPTTTMTNACSFNYIPNSSCTADIKGTTCYGNCVCSLAP